MPGGVERSEGACSQLDLFPVAFSKNCDMLFLSSVFAEGKQISLKIGTSVAAVLLLDRHAVELIQAGLFAHIPIMVRRKKEEEFVGEKNDVLCTWLEKPAIFADFINGSLFQGKKYIVPEELSDISKTYCISNKKI